MGVIIYKVNHWIILFGHGFHDHAVVEAKLVCLGRHPKSSWSVLVLQADIEVLLYRF